MHSIQERLPIGFPTFSLPERSPTALFALSLDVAKFLQLRDSYAFFYRYPQVDKIWTEDYEREKLVQMGIMNPLSRTRQLAMVSVAQVYEVLGNAIFDEKRFESDGIDPCEIPSLLTASHYAAPSLPKPASFSVKVVKPADLSISKSAIFDKFKNSLTDDQVNKLQQVKEGEEWLFAECLKAALYDKEIAKQRKNRIQNLIEESVISLQKVNAVSCFEEIEEIANEKLSTRLEYPLALMPGQYQEINCL